MKIKGKVNADIRQFLIKHNGNNEGKEAFIDLDIAVKKDEAAQKFGDDFALLAFATMQIMKGETKDDPDAIAFLVDNVKPGSRVVFEKHVIQIDGHEVMAQPELRGIRTVEGEARVVAQLRIPIDVNKKLVINLLAGRVGEVIKAEFDPVQIPLPFAVKKGSKQEKNEEAAEKAAN